MWLQARALRDPPAFSAAAPEIPGDPPASLTWSETDDVLKLQNDDGVWWIFKRCFDRTDRGRRISAGPGYIVRLRDSAGRLLVDDYRARRDVETPGYLNAVNGGLGTFGFHYVRGPAGRTPAGDDPTTRVVERQVDRLPPGYSVEGRMCAAKNRGYGVARVRSGRPKRTDAGIEYRIEVSLRDPAGTLARVDYVYRFERSAVHTWIAVSTLPRRNAFLKEPKLVAGLRGGGFRRMAVFGKDGRFLKGVLEGAPETTKVLHTQHVADPLRARVRWDYGTSALAEGRRPCARGACFEIAMYASAGPPPVLWENGAVGFDGWAVASARRAMTWPRDTEGVEVVSSCSVATDAMGAAGRSRASEDASPADDSVRRWELGGWKARHRADPVENPNPYTTAVASFIGWEGGRGPGDCEPLERAWPSEPETWTAYAVYSVGSLE